MTMYLTECTKERDSATILRMLFEMIALLAAILIKTLIIGDTSRECEKPPFQYLNNTLLNNTDTNDSINLIINSTLLYKSQNTTQQEYSFFNRIESRYFLVALGYSSSFIIAEVLLALAVKEKPGNNFINNQ